MCAGQAGDAFARVERIDRTGATLDENCCLASELAFVQQGIMQLAFPGQKGDFGGYFDEKVGGIRENRVDLVK